MTKAVEQAIREAVAMELEWVARVLEPELRDQEKWNWILVRARSIREGAELAVTDPEAHGLRKGGAA